MEIVRTIFDKLIKKTIKITSYGKKLIIKIGNIHTESQHTTNYLITTQYPAYSLFVHGKNCHFLWC